MWTIEMYIFTQCRRKPKWAPPRELPQFSDHLLVVTRHPPEEQPSFSSAWGPLYGLFFTTNKALSGLPLNRDRVFFPVPPGRGVRGGLRRLCFYVKCSENS